VELGLTSPATHSLASWAGLQISGPSLVWYSTLTLGTTLPEQGSTPGTCNNATGQFTCHLGIL
jgi:hypothetical protein